MSAWFAKKTSTTTKKTYWIQSLCFGFLFVSFLGIIFLVKDINNKDKEGDRCHYSLICLILFQVAYFSWLELRQLMLLGWQDYLFTDSWNIRQLVAIILVTTSVVLEFVDLENDVGKSAILKAFALLFTWSGGLFYGWAHWCFAHPLILKSMNSIHWHRAILMDLTCSNNFFSWWYSVAPMRRLHGSLLLYFLS